MKFFLRPILSEIKELYQQPISGERFNEYLSMLQGDTKVDLVLPISGFNPMAKEHIMLKIEELQSLDAEGIMDQSIALFNSELEEKSDLEIMVVLNLADDLKGGWTNFYSTDFDSKFKLNALVIRQFCVPYFWTSETYNEALIQTKTKEYLYRTLYLLKNRRPSSLKEYFEQEVFVALNCTEDNHPVDSLSFDPIGTHYWNFKESEEYDLIFNFFYGDKGSESLGYKKYGVDDITGFEYAKYIALKAKIGA